MIELLLFVIGIVLIMDLTLHIIFIYVNKYLYGLPSTNYYSPIQKTKAKIRNYITPPIVKPPKALFFGKIKGEYFESEGQPEEKYMSQYNRLRWKNDLKRKAIAAEKKANKTIKRIQ